MIIKNSKVLTEISIQLTNDKKRLQTKTKVCYMKTPIRYTSNVEVKIIFQILFSNSPRCYRAGNF